jgi:predicted RNase H-like HicB family nuclease
MKEIVFKVEEDNEDGGYVAEANTSDNEHIITQGETIDELKYMIKNALDCHLANPLEMPHKVIMQFIKQEFFAF